MATSETELARALAEALDERGMLEGGWMPSEFVVLGIARRWHDDGSTETKYFWHNGRNNQEDYITVGVVELCWDFAREQLRESARD